MRETFQHRGVPEEEVVRSDNEPDVQKVQQVSGADPVIAAGTGSRLLVPLLGARDLACDIGDAASALPAHAVREVMRRDLTW